MDLCWNDLSEITKDDALPMIQICISASVNKDLSVIFTRYFGWIVIVGIFICATSDAVDVRSKEGRSYDLTCCTDAV